VKHEEEQEGKKTQCGAYVGTRTPFYYVFKVAFRFRSMWVAFILFFFLQTSYKPIYTLNLNCPCSYPYPGKDLISYLDVNFSKKINSFKYNLTRSHNFEIRGS